MTPGLLGTPHADTGNNEDILQITREIVKMDFDDTSLPVEEENAEAVHRDMAHSKKSGELPPKQKEFERPSDPTLHENSHPSAKGPPSYKCLFAPCPYVSKRRRNAKQHMEKAHGWKYVRSKSGSKSE